MGAMPIGDPGGGNFRYTTEGLPESVFMASVPSADPFNAVKFYSDTLKMDVVAKTADEVFLSRGEARIRIFKSDKTGVDTGIYLGVNDPYDFRRRMSDEGVEFVSPPMRRPMGVATSFYDRDRNVLHAIETGAEPM